ncbi:MAG: response regulator [Alphaproteobacteria bacterium]|nr:response regulator [Alphaproteobacteria bacterium]
MVSDKRGARILIVDDEPIIALDLEQGLVNAGYEIAGVTGKIEKALSVVASGACDAAILDANLGGASATPIAAALTARGLPFLVLSGYSAHQQPEALRAAPHLQKPANWPQLIKMLSSILAARR